MYSLFGETYKRIPDYLRIVSFVCSIFIRLVLYGMDIINSSGTVGFRLDFESYVAVVIFQSHFLRGFDGFRKTRRALLAE